MRIRIEEAVDIEAVHRVETAAFGRDAEARLVDQLRANDAVTLSLVAVQEDTIVGHILFSPVTVTQDDELFQALALGPVAVLPTHQNQGVGSALCRAGLEHCAAMGHELVFLVGHQGYYPRFGFQAAVPLRFDCAYTTPGESNAHFMVAELREGALAGRFGFVRYRPEFDEV